MVVGRRRGDRRRRRGRRGAAREPVGLDPARALRARPARRADPRGRALRAPVRPAAHGRDRRGRPRPRGAGQARREVRRGAPGDRGPRPGGPGPRPGAHRAAACGEPRGHHHPPGEQQVQHSGDAAAAEARRAPEGRLRGLDRRDHHRWRPRHLHGRPARDLGGAAAPRREPGPRHPGRGRARPGHAGEGLGPAGRPRAPDRQLPREVRQGRAGAPARRAQARRRGHHDRQPRARGRHRHGRAAARALGDGEDGPRELRPAAAAEGLEGRRPRHRGLRAGRHREGPAWPCASRASSSWPAR